MQSAGFYVQLNWMVPWGWELSKQPRRVVLCYSELIVCLCPSLRVVPPPYTSFITGFFKVLGQLTETGVASPEQFISEYVIISWHFHRGCWEPEDTDADSKAAWV